MKETSAKLNEICDFANLSITRQAVFTSVSNTKSAKTNRLAIELFVDTLKKALSRQGISVITEDQYKKSLSSFSVEELFLLTVGFLHGEEKKLYIRVAKSIPFISNALIDTLASMFELDAAEIKRLRTSDRDAYDEELTVGILLGGYWLMLKHEEVGNA